MLTAGMRRGFTLVELLVTMSVLALLVALGAPAMGTYLQNAKLASATSSLYAAIQTARTEAIRRNTRAEFVMTDTPVTPNVANVLAPAPAGINWVVRAVPAAGPMLLVDAKAGLESEAANVAPAIQLAGAATAPTVFDGTIPFNGFGATTTNATYTIDVTNPTAGVCANGGGAIRCRRIVVTPGGQVTACDPAAALGDSRACPP